MSRMVSWLRALFPRPDAPPPVGDRLHNELMTAITLRAAVNRQRRALNLFPLFRDDALDRAAQRHAEYMAVTGSLEHAQPGGCDAGERAFAAGYRWDRLAEFVLADGARGRSCTADEAAARLDAEPQAARVLLSRMYEDLGVGVARARTGRRTWCVLAGTRLPESRAGIPSAAPFCPPGMLVWGDDEPEQPSADAGAPAGSVVIGSTSKAPTS